MKKNLEKLSRLDNLFNSATLLYRLDIKNLNIDPKRIEFRIGIFMACCQFAGFLTLAEDVSPYFLGIVKIPYVIRNSIRVGKYFMNKLQKPKIMDIEKYLLNEYDGLMC